MRFRTALLTCTASFGLLSGATEPKPVDRVNPFIGTGGHGHTFPGPSLPFGMVQPGPDTRLTGWDGCGGYHASDSVIYGFSHTHLSGVGVSDYGDILLLPATGPVKLRNGYRAQGEQRPTHDPSGYGSAFRKATEKATAGHYAVTLEDYGVKAELTATLRTGFHRYTFQKTENAHVLLDLTHRDEVLASSLRVLDDHTVAGMRRSRAWAKDQPVYFVARFDRPFRATLAVDDVLKTGLRSAEGRNLKAVLHFDLKPGQAVQAQVALSGVDEAGARRNLAAELPHWDFQKTHQAARSAWSRELDRVQVQGGTEAEQRIFYTGLYHAYLQPNVFTDVDGRYFGRDGKVHEAKAHTQHTVFSLWDTFRAAHPLYTILQMKRTRDFLRTFLAQYDQGGLLPVWELWGNETDCMIANHAIPVIVDAWLKGIRDFDGEKAFQAMKKSAMQERLGMEAYRQFGFIPHDQEAESVSKTLEYAYNDWCIAQMAKALGKGEDHATFLKRSQAYLHLLDPETGILRPRSRARFLTPFDPTEVNHHFTEANAWQYTFFVPHDIGGHFARLGGPEAYAAKLDALFSAPSQTTGRQQVDITGLMGQYAHGNEPSHHVAYLYAFVGQPWKTQATVARLRHEMYQDAPDGLSGNEDCGQMSAWYVFSALGFYPVNPCGGQYVLGTPTFQRATLQLENGRRFTVRAQGLEKGPYVQSVTLNGQPWNRSWFSHEDLMRGGELVFRLGAEPNHTWGSALEERPLSEVAEHRIQPAPFVASGETVFQERTNLVLASTQPGAHIHLTTDASTPTPASPRYTAPLAFDQDVVVTFRAFTDGLPPSPVAEARLRRMPAPCDVQLLTTPQSQYRPAPGVLADGIRGSRDFRLGGWLGFEATDLLAIVDLKTVRPVKRLALGCLQDINSWIFMPTEVVFEGSIDGLTWRPAGTVSNPVDPRKEGVVLHDFVLNQENTQVRYIRVRARNLMTCPVWHKGAGGPSFLFTDELTVE